MTQRGLPSVAMGVAAALAVCGIAGCAPGPDAGDEETSITIATSAIPGTWDPFQNASLFSPALHPVYEPLIRDEGGFSPALAKSWELSDDTSSIEFTLNEDVDYVDGTHLTAQTVADYLSTLYEDPNFAAYYLVSGDRLVTVEATGEYTLKLTRQSTIADYDWRPKTIPYGWLGSIPIISPAAVADRSLLEDAPQGTGPYLVDEYKPDVSISFVRNPDYRNPDAYPFDRVTFVAFSDNVAVLNALKSGQVDTGVLGADLVGEAEASGMNIDTGLGTTTYLEFTDLDGSSFPALGDPRVRQAMSMAFDRQAIGDAINQGHGYATSQLFTSDSYEYVEGGDDRYPYDPEAARELLAEAGYPDGFDLTIPVTATGGAEYFAVIEQYLGDIGVNVTLETVPDADITVSWAESGVALVGLAIASGDPEFFLPDNFLNGDWGPNPDIVRLSALAKTGTEQERVDALIDLGPLMLDEARFIPIGYVPTFYVSRPGYEVTLLNSFARSAFLEGYRPSN